MGSRAVEDAVAIARMLAPRTPPRGATPAVLPLLPAAAASPARLRAANGRDSPDAQPSGHGRRCGPPSAGADLGYPAAGRSREACGGRDRGEAGEVWSQFICPITREVAPAARPGCPTRARALRRG